jgi:hypothetical protein
MRHCTGKLKVAINGFGVQFSIFFFFWGGGGMCI